MQLSLSIITLILPVRMLPLARPGNWHFGQVVLGSLTRALQIKDEVYESRLDKANALSWSIFRTSHMKLCFQNSCNWNYNTFEVACGHESQSESEAGR